MKRIVIVALIGSLSAGLLAFGLVYNHVDFMLAMVVGSVVGSLLGSGVDYVLFKTKGRRP